MYALQINIDNANNKKRSIYHSLNTWPFSLFSLIFKPLLEELGNYDWFIPSPDSPIRCNQKYQSYLLSNVDDVLSGECCKIDEYYLVHESQVDNTSYMECGFISNENIIKLAPFISDDSNTFFGVESSHSSRENFMKLWKEGADDNRLMKLSEIVLSSWDYSYWILLSGNEEMVNSLFDELLKSSFDVEKITVDEALSQLN